MSTVRVLLPALGASFVFTLGGAGEKLLFQPQVGSSLTKSYTIAGEFALDEISVIVDGQDLGGMLGQIEVSAKQESRIEVTDSYKAVAHGRPTEILRTFEVLSATMNMEMTPAQAEMPEFSSTSALEGKTVAFRWNEEQEEYERSFHESGGDEELLEGLEEDMDLRAFLPSGEVSADDVWSIELTELKSIVAPGGNLRMLPTDQEVDEEMMQKFEELFSGFGEEFGDLLEGSCTCTYKGAREEGGVRVGEIAIELEVATTLDLSEFLDKIISAAIEESGAGEALAFTLETADFNLDFEGTGTLLWNLAAGRVHSFQIAGDATLDIDISVSVEAQGESHELDASLELAGSIREEVVATE